MPKKIKRETVADANEILDRIERVVRWADEFRLAFVRCNQPIQREEMRHRLLERLSDKRVLEIFLEQPILSLLDTITARWDAANPPDAVCVYGLEKSIQEQREASRVLGRLNHDRDLIRRACPAALLIWLPDFALDCVVRGAPDFWAWRSGVYEFPTDTRLWQMDSDAVLDADVPVLFSLNVEDKRKEIARLEELLRTARTLPQQGKREQEIVARLLHQLGLLHISLGEWDTAQERFEESLKISRQIGYQHGIADTLRELGVLARRQGDYEHARARLEESLVICQRLDNQQGIAATLHDLAKLDRLQGNYEASRMRFFESLNIKQQLGVQSGIAVTLHELGRMALQEGDYKTARTRFFESLKITQLLDNPFGIAVTLHQLGMLAQAEGDYETARVRYEESLQINQRLGYQLGIALTLWAKGNLEQAEGNLVKAVDLWQQALDIFERLGAPQAAEVRRLLAEAKGKQP